MNLLDLKKQFVYTLRGTETFVVKPAKLLPVFD